MMLITNDLSQVKESHDRLYALLRAVSVSTLSCTQEPLVSVNQIIAGIQVIYHMPIDYSLQQLNPVEWSCHDVKCHMKCPLIFYSGTFHGSNNLQLLTVVLFCYVSNSQCEGQHRLHDITDKGMICVFILYYCTDGCF